MIVSMGGVASVGGVRGMAVVAEIAGSIHINSTVRLLFLIFIFASFTYHISYFVFHIHIPYFQ
jgi:hypothetical protein